MRNNNCTAQWPGLLNVLIFRIPGRNLIPTTKGNQWWYSHQQNISRRPFSWFWLLCILLMLPVSLLFIYLFLLWLTLPIPLQTGLVYGHWLANHGRNHQSSIELHYLWTRYWMEQWVNTTYSSNYSLNHGYYYLHSIEEKQKERKMEQII